MKNCNKKLKDLIEDVVLLDVEDYIDEIFEEINKNKKATKEQDEELQNMHEMRDELKSILQSIENNELDSDECEEIYIELTALVNELADEE